MSQPNNENDLTFDQIKAELELIDASRKFRIAKAMSEYDQKFYFPHRRRMRELCTNLGHQLEHHKTKQDGSVMKVCKVCGVFI